MKKILLALAVLTAFVFAGCKQNADPVLDDSITLPAPVGEDPFGNVTLDNGFHSFVIDPTNRTMNCDGIEIYNYSYNSNENLLYVLADKINL